MQHRCEELREIVRRLTKVLPGHGPAADQPSTLEVAPGWSWRRTVIEAKPILLAKLSPVCGKACWRFEKEIPPLHQDMQSRRRFLRQQTSIQTSQDDPCTSEATLPPGSSMWHAPDDARRLLLLARQDARMLFENMLGALDETLPVTKNEDSVTLFDNRHGEDPVDMCFRDCVKILRLFAPYVARLAEEYAKSLTWMYGVGAREFEESCRLRVQWIKPGNGTPAELLPMSPCRYENGPMVFAAIGQSVVFHDLVPSLADTSTADDGPVRLSVPEGVMLVLDGASRVRYAHGTPAGLCALDSRFNLIFLMDCSSRSFPVSYERETRAIVMQTPVVHDRVVSTLIDVLATSSPPVQLRDCFTLTISALRRKLRSSESFLITDKCLHRLALTSS